jgi:hypothetical protein
VLQRLRRWLVGRVPPAAHPGLSAVWHGETAAQRTLSGSFAALRTSASRRGLSRSGAVKAVPTRHGPLLATRVDRFSAAQVLEDSLALVVTALEAAGVPYAVLDAAVMSRRVVIVGSDQADQARQALQLLHRGDAVYASAVGSGQKAGAPGLVGDLDRHARLGQASVLRLFRVLTAGVVVLAADELGCDLEFWPVVEAGGVPRADGSDHVVGTALAPRPNRRAMYLTPAHRQPVAAVVGSREVTTYQGLLTPHAFDIRFPVDVVYTWVDGSDPAWLDRKAQAWAQTRHGDRHDFAANAGRFASHDELRYSLRSLEMYAGWVRNVFIVTDDQVPAWLNLEHPKVRLVDHRELFGQGGVLPTFNSHAIESRLHHLAGLAEHYLYLNDDVLFGRAVAPELFFHASGLTKFFLSTRVVDLDPPSPRDLPVVSAAKNSRALIENAFGATITHRFQHVAHPLRRSVMAELEDRFPEELARTAASQFRSPEDISAAAFLAHYYGFMTGQAVPDTIDYRYIDISTPKAVITLQRLLRGREADVFCVNEVDSSTVDPLAQKQILNSFLDAYFPVPSQYETDVS